VGLFDYLGGRALGQQRAFGEKPADERSASSI
jgi:hypothetical protein